MNVQELRIGNLVLVDNPKYHPLLAGIPLKVTGIKEAVDIMDDVKQPSYSITLETMGDYVHQYSQLLRFIRPIPITPEILEKAGFDKSLLDENNPDEGWYYTLKLSDDVYCDLSFIDGDKNGYCEMCLFPYTNQFRYRYVHQIQGLYHAITAQELPITL